MDTSAKITLKTSGLRRMQYPTEVEGEYKLTTDGCQDSSDSKTVPTTTSPLVENRWKMQSPGVILDEVKFRGKGRLEDVQEKSNFVEDKTLFGDDVKPRAADWRFGPAKLWYDMYKVPENAENFDYGLSIKRNEENCVFKDFEPFPDDAYLMVTQCRWEDDVVWDANDIKHKFSYRHKYKNNAGGWLPFADPLRTLHPAEKAGRPACGDKFGIISSSRSGFEVGLDLCVDNQNDTWVSIFPPENQELVYGIWEDEVIWDAEQMPRIPLPKILTLDPNDENIILGVPEDVDSMSTLTSGQLKLSHPYEKHKKIVFNKSGISVVVEEETHRSKQSPLPDPFNVSNDGYYMTFSSDSTALQLKAVCAKLIKHSLYVIELRPPVIPSYIGPTHLRKFHRWPLKRYSHGRLAHPGPHPVVPLLGHQIKAKDEEREKGFNISVEDLTSDDLSGKTGEMVLVEFCEEHPPLINQVGMCSVIMNYYKRTVEKEQVPQKFRYGELAFVHSSPFLGMLQPGSTIQALENNMYRAPIYEHSIPETDFIIIRTRDGYFIRETDVLYTAGQLCPLYEVPGPHAKSAVTFVKDLIQVFIYRLFWNSPHIPRRVNMCDIKKAFPAYSEVMIRNRLKVCAEPRIVEKTPGWWEIKPDFILPSEEEIRAMVSPERCCAYFSMAAAHQRLLDAGYADKVLSHQEDDLDNLLPKAEIESEVKVAPWYTTRAYIQAVQGKCSLQLTGPADPTGCGEGFSFIKVPSKPSAKAGIDVDPQKLSVSGAKAALRKFGVPEEKIKKLSSWEIIDAVRTLHCRSGKEKDKSVNKLLRSCKISASEQQKRYENECQRIFDLQNHVLSSNEVLSTDDDDSSCEDSPDLVEMGKNLESQLCNKSLLPDEKKRSEEDDEEVQRLELYKIMMNSRRSNKRNGNEEKGCGDTNNNRTHPECGQILKIVRSFRNCDGKEYTRVEVVRRGAVIDAYLKIRTTKDESYIRNYATPVGAQKIRMMKEKYKIQYQLKCIERYLQRKRLSTLRGKYHGIRSSRQTEDSRVQESSTCTDSRHPLPDKSQSPQNIALQRKGEAKIKSESKVKCGACGNVGHMRRNRICPLFSSSFPAMTVMEEREIEKELATDQDLVCVDGVKLKLSSTIVKRVEEMKRRSLIVRVSKQNISNSHEPVKRKCDLVSKKCDFVSKKCDLASKKCDLGSKKCEPDEVHCVKCEPAKKLKRPSNRCRTDPVVVLSTMLEAVLNEMRNLPDTENFLFPVSPKEWPDYLEFVSNPMDLQTMREKLRQRKYNSRGQFLADVNQIVENSTIYNGGDSWLTAAACSMMELCVKRIKDEDEEFIRLEASIGVLQDTVKSQNNASTESLGQNTKAIIERWNLLETDLQCSSGDEDLECTSSPTTT